MNLPASMRALMSLAMTGVSLAACSQGPGEAELAQACLAGSTPQLVTEAMCKCYAREAQTKVPPRIRHAMLLEMQGKKQEAAAAFGDLTFDQRAEIAVQQLELLAQCADEG